MSTLVSDKNITNEVVSAIKRNQPGLGGFEALRKDGLSYLEKLGLPGNKSEEYKHTPISRLLEKNFDFSGASQPPSEEKIAADIFIPGQEGTTLVFINGKFSPGHSRMDVSEDGIMVLPFSKAADHHQLISQYLGKIADHTSDAFVAWNTASWTDGVLIHVSANKNITNPIIIHHVHDTTAGQVISAVRNLVIVDRNSEVTVLEKFDSHGSSNGFSSVVSEAAVAENAGLTWYSIQNDNQNRYHFELRQINQANASRVHTFTFSLDGKLIRNNLHLALDGEGIDSHMYGLYLVGKDTLADNHTVVDHKQPHSFSNEMYKGIIDGRAKGVFNGKIYVRPNAQKTNAFQANRNILLTDQATVNTKPQLEIWADDVKCSHGCTSGQLDEEAVFYLRTRGIAKDTAQAMMLYAFASELLDTMKHPVIKAYIDSLISERLHKNF